MLVALWIDAISSPRHKLLLLLQTAAVSKVLSGTSDAHLRILLLKDLKFVRE